MSTPTQPLSSLKLYGRRYALAVSLPSLPANQVINLADSSFEPEALRVTFDVQTVFYHDAYWKAEIVIYNLDQTTTQQLISGAGASLSTPGPVVVPIKQGMNVQLQAGYQQGNYGTIWNGPVFQVMFVRENVTDYKVTLNCLMCLDPLVRTYMSQTFGSGVFTQTDVIKKLAQAAFGNQFGSSPNVSANVKPTVLSRAKTVFGSASKYFTQIADDNNMQWYFDGKALNLGRVDEDVPATASSARVFTPETGIVGTPEQTQYGVNLRVLLDPTVKVKYPAMLVNIDNSQIVQYKKTIGEQPGILDQSGTYIVSGVRYWGDTRGTAWYADITGITSVGGMWAAAQYVSPAGAPSYNHPGGG